VENMSNSVSLCTEKPCDKKNLMLVVILIYTFMKLVPEKL